MSDCSVVIGIRIGYSPSRSPCRACTPIHPAPKIGSPGISTLVMVMRTSGSGPGSRGGGSTAAMMSGSVSYTAVTASDQMSAFFASISRFTWLTRAP